MAEDTAREPAAPAPPPPAPAGGSRKAAYLAYLAGALAILLAGTLAWKFSSVRHVEERAAAERTEIVERARVALADQTAYFLRLVAKPLAWAVRKELLRENHEQVNEYLAQFVREPRVRQVLVADPDGVVVAATDKKLEGQPLAESHPGLTLDADETTIAETGAGELLVVAPVMGLDSRLGTLLVVYTPETAALEAREEDRKAP